MRSNATGAVISAFTEEQTERLTGISRSQLRYWDSTGFFVPSAAEDNRRLAFSRIYSYRDILSLRVLNALRNRSQVPLQHLREVKERLTNLGDKMWSQTTLYVFGRRVVFDNPETRRKEEVVSGQGVLEIPLRVVTGEADKEIRKLWRRDKKTVGKVHKKRGVASSRPVIAGTRIPVAAVRAFHDEGYSVKQIQKEYPTLTAEDVKAAIAYKTAA